MRCCCLNTNRNSASLFPPSSSVYRRVTGRERTGCVCVCIVGTCVAMVQWQKGTRKEREGGGLHRTVAKMKQHKNSIYITLNFPGKKKKKNSLNSLRICSLELIRFNRCDQIEKTKSNFAIRKKQNIFLILIFSLHLARGARPLRNF